VSSAVRAVTTAAMGSILALMKALGLFQAATCDAWRVVLKAIFALSMSDAELGIYRHLTGRQTAPGRPFHEF
jgi:hypothetical protein